MTILFLLALFATIISYPFTSGATASAKFRYARDVKAASSAVLSDDYTLDYSGNASLVKRAMAPMSSLAEVDELTARGCQLITWMLATEQEAYQALDFTSISKFWLTELTGATSAWTRTVLEAPFDPNTLVPFLIGLNHVDEFNNRRLPIDARSTWMHTDYLQQDQYRRHPNGRIYDATLGNYEMISTASSRTSAGVIILISAYGPRFQNERASGPNLPTSELPEVSLWSDVGYIEYGKISGWVPWGPLDDPVARPTGPGQTRFKSPPTWIMFPKVWGPTKTKSIISHCVFTYYGLLDLPTWQNRVTFPIGSPCFDAITGTAQGESLSWLLITHKYRMRACTMGSVTIWGSGVSGDDGYEFPAMLWWITTTIQKSSAPVQQTIGQIRNDNMDHAATPDSDLANFPHKLRPVPG